MSRAYRAVRPRANAVYSVEDVMRLYGVCRNTLSNWVGSGLHPIDTRQPQLVRGAELIQFQIDRRSRTSLQLRGGEFKCLGCEDKAGVPADIGKVEGLVSAWHTANDRTIYAWQIYAGRFDSKTVDAHLTSLRDFETFLGGKLFKNVTRADADSWRSALGDRARKPSNLGGQGRSTL